MPYEIRHVRPDDYEAVTRLFAGANAVWGTLQTPFPSTELWRRRLAEPPAGLHSLVACHESEVVGMLGLHTHPEEPRRRHAAELGMVVRDDWQRRGVGTALLEAGLRLADGWLQLTRLELSVWFDNEPALRLYRKFGFEPEGVQRQHAFRDGRFIDAQRMARLRPVPPSSHEPAQ